MGRLWVSVLGVPVHAGHAHDPGWLWAWEQEDTIEGAYISPRK